jgi:hypothetical protein
LAALLSLSLGGWVFAALALPFAAAFILWKQRNQAEVGDLSVTPVVAALHRLTPLPGAAPSARDPGPLSPRDADRRS